MASETTQKRLLLAGIALAALGGCSTGMSVRRFPLQAPLWRDTDLDPVAMKCHADPKPPKDKPNHQVCTPEEYVSSFSLDGADNILLRPMVRFFAVDPAGEALNVNSMDEVADSSWFVNRIGRGNFTAADVTSGYCGTEVLDPNSGAGTWVIDQGKSNGANPGFRVNVPGVGGKFMLKSDPPEQPERATGATSIATRLYYAAGWWAPCDSVVYFDPAVLKLKPGLTVTDNTGVTKPFDEAALKKLLAGASHRGPLVRMVASRWLPGRTIGPFTYAGVRKDDPGDVIPHEHRRDLRGARLFAAWTSHFDSREQNTMTTWMSATGDPMGSPGHFRHWYIDLGDCFGSEWDWEGMSKRLSYSYYFDIPYIAEDFLSLGIPERHWDHANRSENGAIFGFFESADFDPEMWRGGYPNPTFANMTEHDAAWAARLIARFTPEDVLAAVKVGDYTDPRHTPFIVDHLLVRQRRILERYFSKLSPMTDFKVEGTTLCGVDLARKTKTFPETKFAYSAKLFASGGAGEELTPRFRLMPAVADEGQVCFSLTHVAQDGGEKDGAPSRYLFVDIANGQAEAPVRIHFYDLGPSRGFRIVGLER